MLFPTFSCLRIIVGVIDISCVNLSGVVTSLVLGQFLAAKYGSIRWFFNQWNQGQSHRVRPYVLFCSFGFNHSFWYRFVCRCATDPVDLSPYVERVPPLARVPEFIYIATQCQYLQNFDIFRVRSHCLDEYVKLFVDDCVVNYQQMSQQHTNNLVFLLSYYNIRVDVWN